MRHLILIPLIVLLCACSNVPELIRKPPEGNPPLALVRAEPGRHDNARVRWGGTIAQVQNLQEETRVEIVARELAGDGEPRGADRSEGRFIAIFDNFLDPVIYAVERNITVVGTVSGSSEQQLGTMHYRYPLVRVEGHYLWPKPVPRCETCDPLFYDPWYPWYPYPWHRYPYY